MPRPKGVTNSPHDPTDALDENHAPGGHEPDHGTVTEHPGAEVIAQPSGLLGELRLWLVSLLLFTPVLVPYVTHFTMQEPGRLPTGFVDYDMPSYMANAREHFDAGRFRFFYSNPFDPSYASPAIYTQPQSVVLGVIMQLTGIAPNHLFLLYALLAGWICARVAVALYAEVVGLNGWARQLGLLVFFWGGGLMVLAGIPYSLAVKRALQNLFILDPMGGWWMLNFGRNMVYPPECLYHALSFGCILSILRRKFWLATLLAFLLSWSHPFTGVEVLLILVSWAALELFFVQSDAVPRAFFGALTALLILHLAYYLGYLNLFPEHRTMMKKWSQPWLLQATQFVPAYGLVGALAVWSFRRLELARNFFSISRNRLFLVWFLIAFALANHEFAIDPIQPLHFTRGYIWTPLFFMGSGTLIGLFAALRQWGGRLAVGAFVAVFLLDNATWFAAFPWEATHGKPAKYWSVTTDQLALYDWLSGSENQGVLLVTEPQTVGYLAATYTPLRSWAGHPYDTNGFSTRLEEVAAFLGKGKVVDAWRGKPLLLTLERSTPEPRWLAATGAKPVYENPEYRVYRVTPPSTGDYDSGHPER
jgi:hypothetical protein